MAQDFTLNDILGTSTGSEMVVQLHKLHSTLATMSSGSGRPPELEKGCWVKENPDGSHSLMYSEKTANFDCELFSIVQGGVSSIGSTVSLASAGLASTTSRGTVQLATQTEALAGTSATRVPLVKDTQAMIQKAVDGLVNGSSSALDTLKELSTALGDDANFSTTINNALAKRVRVDAAQTLTDAEKAQARSNMALGALATKNTIATADIDANAVTTAQVGTAQVTKDKLGSDVFASSVQSLVSAPPADQAISPSALFDVLKPRVVATPNDAPTTLAGNSYKQSFYVASTNSIYLWVADASPAGFKLLGQGLGTLNDLSDVDTSRAANGHVLVYSSGFWLPQAAHAIMHSGSVGTGPLSTTNSAFTKVYSKSYSTGGNLLAEFSGHISTDTADSDGRVRLLIKDSFGRTLATSRDGYASAGQGWNDFSISLVTPAAGDLTIDVLLNNSAPDNNGTTTVREAWLNLQRFPA